MLSLNNGKFRISVIVLNRSFILGILLILLLAPAILIFNAKNILNPDVYQSYAVSTAYMENVGNISKIGINTLGPVIPVTIAVLRLFFDPGSDIHSMEVFLRILSFLFVALAWIASLFLLRSQSRDWRALATFSVLFLLAIDWGDYDYRSLDGELFSAPFLIVLLSCAPLARWTSGQGLTNLCVSALLLAVVFLTKLQAYPIACFAFVFADALRNSFTIREALWRFALVGALSAALVVSPILLDLRGQALVANALAYLRGAEAVAPTDQLFSSVRDFLHKVVRSLFGLWVAVALTILAMCFLKPPAGRNIRFGVTQAEWFTLGFLMITVACIAVSRRFFLHYSLLLLPAFPLIFNALIARLASLKSKRWNLVALVGLSVLVVFYQWKSSMRWRPEIDSEIQPNAELVRAACPDKSLPVVVHGHDYRYYIALGSYPSISGLDVARQAGYPPNLVDAYGAYLRKGSSLIIDIVNPDPGSMDHDYPRLDDLLGSSADKYRRIDVAPQVTAYCPKTGL